MRKLFSFLLPSAICLLPASVPADALWDRAIGVATANRDLVPGRWTERREVFNVKNEVELTTTTVVTFSMESTGSIDVRLEQALSDNLDITDEKRPLFDDEKDRFHLRNPEHNPFHPAYQGKVRAQRDGRTRAMGATILIAYAYRQETNAGAWEGVAWIDEVSGRPAELSARMLGLPITIDKDQRHAYILNVAFYTGPDGSWHPSRIITSERATLNSFPYSKFYCTIETSIMLENFWKIEFP